MTLRRLFFWLHLAVGLSVGIVVAFLALTGTILAFQPQITSFAERNLRIAQPASPASCVAPSALLTAAGQLQHAAPTTLTLFADPHRPAEVAFGRDTLLLLNPCTGALLSDRAGRLRSFFLNVRDLHRWIALDGVRHETLRALKNAATLGFLFLLLSGLFIWLPRKLTWQHIKPTVLFRRRLHGRAREWNLHNIFGIWALLPLLLIVTTGLIMAYPWANALLFRAAGSPPPAQRGEPEGKHSRPLDPEKYATLDPAIHQAIAQDPRWFSLLLRMPSQKEQAIAFTIDESVRGYPQGRVQLSITRKDAAVARWEPFLSNSRGRQWRLYARYLHTGELFGPFGQLVAALACISALVLVWTGFALSLRRFAAWRKRRKPVTPATPARSRQAAAV
jgi:uncharacterized iron-regulated membrane protein